MRGSFSKILTPPNSPTPPIPDGRPCRDTPLAYLMADFAPPCVLPPCGGVDRVRGEYLPRKGTQARNWRDSVRFWRVHCLTVAVGVVKLRHEKKRREEV